MTLKMMLTATVLTCTAALLPAQANEVNISQLMGELLQKQAVELREQLRHSAKQSMQQMMEQIVPRLAETSELPTSSERSTASQESEQQEAAE